MKGNDKDINRFGLLNSLISLINEGEENSSDVTIAKYFLENYNRLQDLNIYDIAEECYVSRATIRRVAKKLGFENFKDLKNQFSEFTDDYSFYRSGIEYDSLENTIAQQISDMAIECERFFTNDKVEAIIQEMNQSSQIVFLTFVVYNSQIIEFQKAMILSGKMVRVVSSKYEDNEVLESLNANDILIVTSIFGFFVSQVIPVVKQSNAKKILLTTVQESEYESLFDEIWQLSSTPQRTSRSVYSVYVTQYCLEKIFAAYIKKYGK